MKKVLIIAQDDLSNKCAELLNSNNFDISSEIKDIDNYELIISLKDKSLSNDDNVQFIIGLHENKDVFKIEELFEKNKVPMSKDNIVFIKGNRRIFNIKNNIKPSGNSAYQELRNDNNVIVIGINRFGRDYLNQIADSLNEFLDNNYKTAVVAQQPIKIETLNSDNDKEECEEKKD